MENSQWILFTEIVESDLRKTRCVCQLAADNGQFFKSITVKFGEMMANSVVGELVRVSMSLAVSQQKCFRTDSIKECVPPVLQLLLQAPHSCQLILASLNLRHTSNTILNPISETEKNKTLECQNHLDHYLKPSLILSGVIQVIVLKIALTDNKKHTSVIV